VEAMQGTGNVGKLLQGFKATNVRRQYSYILRIFIIITVPVALLSPLYMLQKEHIPFTQSNGVQELGL
jgi:hypothetical protein